MTSDVFDLLKACLPLESGKPYNDFEFGVDGANTATALREMASRIDAGGIFVASVCQLSGARTDSFVIRQVTIEYCQKVRNA
jgi:hypothetical protein